MSDMHSGLIKHGDLCGFLIIPYYFQLLFHSIDGILHLTVHVLILYLTSGIEGMNLVLI